MISRRIPPHSMLTTALVCSAAVTAQFVSGKATRDALFLTALDYTALPAMLIATSACSLLLVLVNAKTGGKIAPGRLVPALFAVSGVLLLMEWLLTYQARSAAAVIFYLHISGAGPLLGSGFWLVLSERFDPRTAKKRFGQIAGAGTLGGLLSALLTERVGAVFGVPAMLPVLAAVHFFSAWQIRQLAAPGEGPETPPATEPRESSSPPTPSGSTEPRELPSPPTPSGWRVLARAPHLRHLAALVLLGTTGSALVDYLFKVEAVGMFGRGDPLLRFFAIYYAATSLITFVVQTSSSRFVLERFGLAVTTGTPSGALLAGSIGGLVSPGFTSIMIARAGESILRGSLFRAGYELFYTPIPVAEKRAAKSIVDVGFDRLGDAVGGGLVRAVLMLAPAAQYPTILGLSIAGSAAAIVVASRLNRGYIQALETSLLNRGVELDLADVEDGTTRTVMLGTLSLTMADLGPHRPAAPGIAVATPAAAAAVDPDIQEIIHLRSRDREHVVRVLRREGGLTAALVPHAIPLLARDSVAADALFALKTIAEERVGELIDALIDPNQDFSVRRRLARAFSVCVSQRAVDGLVLALDDPRFEVRFQCGRSLTSIVEKNPRVRIDSQQILAVVLREVTVGRPVWESRRLLDRFDAQEEGSPVDEFVRERASHSLAHVFTLLALVLPREPLQIAFRSLHTSDQYLQGTALEYLEGLLPSPIRERLWPFLEDRRTRGGPQRPRDEVLADLMRSNQSIMLNLEKLQRRADARRAIEATAEPVAPHDPGA
jgi:hypothetical protein